MSSRRIPHPELHASTEKSEGSLRRCIATSTEGIRCRLQIKEVDYERATKALHLAREHTDHHSRSTLIREAVLLQCCVRWHRQKVVYDPKFLDKVVGMYNKVICCQSAQQTTECTKLPMVKVKASSKIKTLPEYNPKERDVAPRTHGMLLRSQGRATNALQTQEDHAGNLVPNKSSPRPSAIAEEIIEYNATTNTNHRLRLRSHVTGPNPALQAHESLVPLFVHYKTGPGRSFFDVLLQDIPKAQSSTGWVYSFTWPSNPGYIKIGYTTKPPAKRMQEWRRCHPGAKLSCTVDVAYPQRVEGLVHVQLALKRVKMLACPACQSCHKEWFKAPAAEVDKVIQDWAKLMDREPLYGADRILTTRWRKIILDMKGLITTGAVLDRLDAEEASEEEDSRDRVACKQPVQLRKVAKALAPAFATALHETCRLCSLIGTV